MLSALFAVTLAVTIQASQPPSTASSSRSAEIAALAAEIDASDEAIHRGKPRALYTTGRSRTFHEYVMACLNRIVLESAPDPAAPYRLQPGSSLIFSLAILPDGTVKSVEVISNNGGPALETMLRSAIRRAAPFPAFPANMVKKYNEMVLTSTVQSASCESSLTGCR